MLSPAPVPTLWRFGRSDGRARWPDPFPTCTAAARWAMTFLQISHSVFAMCRAGSSQRKTWHMCRRVPRSRATYAKSLLNNRTSHPTGVCTAYTFIDTTILTGVCTATYLPLLIQLVCNDSWCCVWHPCLGRGSPPVAPTQGLESGGSTAPRKRVLLLLWGILTATAREGVGLYHICDRLGPPKNRWSCDMRRGYSSDRYKVGPTKLERDVIVFEWSCTSALCWHILNLSVADLPLLALPLLLLLLPLLLLVLFNKPYFLETVPG